MNAKTVTVCGLVAIVSCVGLWTLASPAIELQQTRAQVELTETETLAKVIGELLTIGAS